MILTRGNTLSNALILNLAPTGMVPTRQMSAKVPLQPDEIIQDVLACADMGITIAHLHARDENGRPTYRKDVYAKLISGIREKRSDLVLCVSCSGRGGMTLEQRGEVLTLAGDLQPDMASLTLSSLNFATESSINSPTTVSTLATRMKDSGIKPELEIFDLGMANVLLYLLNRDQITSPLYANLLFGNLATAQARLLEIGVLVSSLPPGTVYSLAGIGSSQLPIAAIAAAMSPGVRIGLEDNLWLDPYRQQPASNVEFVECIHQLAHSLTRTIMTPSDFRTLLGLPPRS